MTTSSRLLGALKALVWTIAPASAADFYQDKTVEIIIPGPVGGGPAESARVFSDFLTKHTAGSPKFVIRAMPGGAGVQALNYLAEIAKPDGKSLLWGPIQFTGALVGGPGYRYDPGTFEVIGTSSLVYVVLANAALGKGIKSPADFLSTPEFNFGGLGRGRSIDFLARSSFDLLGLKYKYVLGYSGQPEIALALARKEIDVSITGHTGYVSLYENQMVKTGAAMPLFYHSPIDPKTGEPMLAKDGAYPKGTQHFIDYVKATGKSFTGPGWEAYKWAITYETWPSWFVAPKGFPGEPLADLRDGYAKVIADPEFADTWRKRFNEDPAFITYGKAQDIQKAFRNISPEALEILKQM